MEMDKFLAVCLQGNVLEAMDLLKEEEGEEARKLLYQYEERFLKEGQRYEFHSGDLWIEDVLNIYCWYYRKALTGKLAEHEEQELADRLGNLLVITAASIDEAEEMLRQSFRKKGYCFLGGLTAPYYGPYIWKHTEKQSFQVALPEGKEEVTVFFLSGFIMLSWAYFATFGKRHTGGFAKPEGIYYVVTKERSVDIESSDFQVNFLKHEAQHLWDYKHYPDLIPANLEYRAKLVELIYTQGPKELLLKFILQAKPDKDLPHPYSAYVLAEHFKQKLNTKDLKATLENIGEETLPEYALELYLENNRALKALGKDTKGVI